MYNSGAASAAEEGPSGPAVLKLESGDSPLPFFNFGFIRESVACPSLCKNLVLVYEWVVGGIFEGLDMQVNI